MSFNTLSRRNDYTGDGTTKVFPFTFKIFDQTQLMVVRRTIPANASSPVEIVLQLGVDYTVTGAGFPAGGSVVLTLAPALNDGVTILGRQPLSQTTSIRNQGVYYPAVIEDALDMARMVDQQIVEEVRRSLRVAITSTGFSTTFGPYSAGDALKILRLNAAGNAFEVVPFSTLASSAGIASGMLKAPTDGVYGGPSGNPAKVAVGDLYEDAFDKVATLLGKMVPPPPQNLSALTLTLLQNYMARAAGTGTLHLVTDVTAPTITPGLTQTYANGFGDSDAGTLQALLDTAQAGLVTLTTADDTGLTNGALTVVAEFDPYAGVSGKSGLYRALIAQIVPTAALPVGAHTAQLVHSTTGATAVLAFWIDDPGTPTVSSLQIQPSGATAYKSGVPYYAAGATLAVRFSAAGAVGSHYAPNFIVAVSTTASSGTAQAAPASPPAAYSAYADNAQLTVASNVYGEIVTATVTAYNSKQVAGTAGTVSAAIRVDTIGSENRVTSGTGQFPTSGYGSAYDSTLSLASNKALQYLAGAYRYPPAVSYVNSLPAGPDYSGLTPDTYNNMRWVTFQLSTVNAATSVSFAFQGAANFGSSAIVSGIALYVRVDGANGTSGWVDGNAAYSGVGSPTANGDAALDVSNSSATSKRITFGTQARTGTVFVRIGIPSGSNKYFGGIA